MRLSSAAFHAQKLGCATGKVFASHVRFFPANKTVIPLADGAAEFFSKPETLNVLRGKLAAEGHAGFPTAYQVVVRCRSNDTLLLSTEYVTHRIIAK